MKQIYFIAALLIISISFIAASCKKNRHLVIEKDISTLSLPELKSTLSGNWRLIYTWQFYNGKKDYSNTYINFYNFSDSIKWIENNVEIVKTIATYSKTRNYFSEDSTYLIYFSIPSQNAFHNWSAEKIKNDTLVIMEQTSNPTSYYLLK